LVSMCLNSVVQENFEKVGRALDSQKESLAGSLEAIQVRLNTLGLVVSSVDRRVGKPSGFGAEFGDSSAFDGLRHLIENQDEFQESFTEVPYSKTLLRLDSLEVARLSQESKPDLEAGLATTDEALQNLKNSFKTSIDTLKTRCLNPLMDFYTKSCHQPGKDIFGRLAKLDERLHELSNDGKAFGSMQFLGGFSSGVPSVADSLTRFKALEDRLSRLETKNTTLRSKIGNLKGQKEVPKPDSSEKANMEPLLERISTLEGNQSGEVVTMEGVSFSGPMDCEVFLKTSVPENIRSAFC
jgi:hypothetical protein